MCEYQSLYYGDDGYIVRCKHCDYYQLAFISTMVTITGTEFEALCQLVRTRCSEEDSVFTADTRSIILTLPNRGICMLLTRAEANRFNKILEETDNEIKSQELIDLFNV